ncbi:MAG: transcription termination/antitermination protein NusA [Planctomycetes bacterium]|nr:transcription termination/antitermination protein NusA [Planctomycetota bacterium]
MNTDLIRFVDAISRDKSIEKEIVFLDLEAAMLSAAQKAYEEAEDIQVAIDRVTGAITATVDGEPLDLKTLGRIAAQTAKQVMMQRIREDERNSIFEEYSQRVGTVVTGTVARFEGGALTVNLGRAEAFLPRSEQIPGDAHHPGERIRAMVLDVREEQNRVKIVLTQTHPDYIRKLFELEVPEVNDHTIQVRALAREAGYRTKIAVSSIDSKVDPVGACVGVRGSRIRNIVDELGGEKIDIVRWNESSQVLITNALKPAEVRETFLCFELGKAIVVVDEDQLSLAIGKRGQNVRLAARLTGWDIDIMTPEEQNKCANDVERALKELEGIGDVVLDKLLAIGVVSLADLAGIGAEPLVKELDMDPALANRVVTIAAEEAKRIAAETAAAKVAAKAAEQAAAHAAEEAAAQAEAAIDETAVEPTTDGGDPEETPDDGESDKKEAGTEASLSAPATADEGVADEAVAEERVDPTQGEKAEEAKETEKTGDTPNLAADTVELADPT